MAHEINIRSNGVAEMAFHGALPWHGLGQAVGAGATIEQWQVAAGLDWSAERAPVNFEVNGLSYDVPGRDVIYRSDTKAPLSVMSDGYRIVQPAECLEFFRDLVAESGYQIETAGSLRGGRKVWALAKNGNAAEVAAGDVVQDYLLMATSLDGTSQTQVIPTAVRVVCANTIRQAIDGAGKGSVSVSHRSTFDAASVKAKMALITSTSPFEAFMANARRMAETHISEGEAREICRALFGQPAQSIEVDAVCVAADARGANLTDFERLMLATPGKAKDVRDVRAVNQVMDLFSGSGMGALHVGSRETRWGLLNAITQRLDHSAGRGADTRLDSAWFGKGDEIKQEAVRLLTQGFATI